MCATIMTLKIVSWQTHKDKLLKVRLAVFVDEQGVPESEEIDDKDAEAIHVLAEDEQANPIATGRLTKDGRIGRMAVLESCRGKNIGFHILQKLIEEAKNTGFTQIRLSSQLHAIPFYEKAGFKRTGKIYDDCGIPHVDMVRGGN